MMHVIAPLAFDEPQRLSALRGLNLLDTPMEERFERITRIATRCFGVRSALLSLVDADRQWFKAIEGSEARQTCREISFCGHGILQDELLVVEDARTDPRFMDSPLVTEGPHVVFYAGCPVHAPDGSRIGMLCINDDEPRAFTSDDAALLRDLAALVDTLLASTTPAAAQSMLIAKSGCERRSELVDPLTRLWNRAGIMELAMSMHERAITDCENYATGILDLDDFRKINDRLGRSAGDEVLAATARRVLGAIRETDIVGSLSGNRFLLLLSPCASESEAMALANMVRSNLADNPISTNAGTACLRASIGMRFVRKGERIGLQSVIDEADRALYEAKQLGKGRVCACSDPHIAI